MKTPFSGLYSSKNLIRFAVASSRIARWTLSQRKLENMVLSNGSVIKNFTATTTGVKFSRYLLAQTIQKVKYVIPTLLNQSLRNLICILEGIISSPFVFYPVSLAYQSEQHVEVLMMLLTFHGKHKTVLLGEITSYTQLDNSGAPTTQHLHTYLWMLNKQVSEKGAKLLSHVWNSLLVDPNY